MKIAVIGDYTSPQYHDLLQIVRMHFPDDKILDLSVHQQADFKKRERSRQEDIKTAHLFVYDYKWENSTEIRQDITYAQRAGLDQYFYNAGKFFYTSYSNTAI
jgi:hypothetical protein